MEEEWGEVGRDEEVIEVRRGGRRRLPVDKVQNSSGLVATQRHLGMAEGDDPEVAVLLAWGLVVAHLTRAAFPQAPDCRSDQNAR